MSGEQTRVSRVRRTKQEAQATYDRLSFWYDLLAEPFEGKHRRAGIDQLDPKPGEQLLELGPGTGHGLVELGADVGPDGRVFGLDISLGMLERARSLLESESTHNVTLQNGDGTKMPFRANSFDAVFISFTLELFDTPEIPEVLEEVKRILHSGGRIAVVSMAQQDRPNLMTRLYEWFHDHFPRYADCRPIWVQQELEKSGFTVVQREDFSMVGLPGAIVLAVFN